MRGEALCRHTQPGRCTWWCSYRRGVLCIAPVVAVIVAAGIVNYVTGDVGVREQMVHAFAAVALFLAATVPVTIFLNHRG